MHDHYFDARNEKVMMLDVFSFRSPLGYMGQLADRLILTTYLRNLLLERNRIIKEYAESDQWKTLLGEE